MKANGKIKTIISREKCQTELQENSFPKQKSWF